MRPSAGRAAPVASATACPGRPGNSLSLRNEAMQRDCPASLSRHQTTARHPRAGWQPVCVPGSRGQQAGRAAPRASACPGEQLWSHDNPVPPKARLVLGWVAGQTQHVLPTSDHAPWTLRPAPWGPERRHPTGSQTSWADGSPGRRN